jgi:hypothetical protein
MKLLSLILSIVAIIGVVLVFQKIPAHKTSDHASAVDAEHHSEEEHLEVAVVMGRIQRFHQKFWLSARAGNTDLVKFYLHEMEEGMEEVANAGIVEEGIDVSANMRAYGLKVVEHLEEVLEKEGVEAMTAQAELLVNSCNSCHKASGYEMIRIRVPQNVDFPDQDFAPIAQ